jgi:hypothetical protein
VVAPVGPGGCNAGFAAGTSGIGAGATHSRERSLRVALTSSRHCTGRGSGQPKARSGEARRKGSIVGADKAVQRLTGGGLQVCSMGVAALTAWIRV